MEQDARTHMYSWVYTFSIMFLLAVFYYYSIISIIGLSSDFYYFSISRESGHFGKKMEFYYFFYYRLSIIFILFLLLLYFQISIIFLLVVKVTILVRKLNSIIFPIIGFL